MAIIRVLLICLLNSLTVTCGSKRLGGRGESVTFVCNGASVGWRLNGVDIVVNNAKYELDQRHLTVRDIVGADEGNYSCFYEQQTYYAGCLLVYGSASFTESSGDIQVSADGTVSFDMTLSFSHHGPTLKNQTVSHYLLKNNSIKTVSCAAHCTVYDSDPHHWWSVENGPVFVLHQAKSTDRGVYIGEVEVTHPGDDSISTLSKYFHVTSLPCTRPYPIITNGAVTSLESVETDINGAQANYSCRDGCALSGSGSLRCWISVNSDWVNESGNVDTPRCLCPSVLSASEKIAALTPTESSKTSSIKGETTRVMGTPGSEKGHGSQEIAVPLGVTTSVVILLLIVFIGAVSILLLIHWRKMRKLVEYEVDVRVEPDDDYNIDTDPPAIHQSVSNVSNSDHDDISSHEDTIHELSPCFKNSQEAIV